MGNGELLANISTAITTTFDTELARQMNRMAVLSSFIDIKPGGGAGGGKQVAWDTEFSGATAQNFAEGSDVQTSEINQDVPVPATLPWGQYRSIFQLSNLDLNAAAASLAEGQPREIGKRVLELAFGSLTKMASVINADFYTGTGTGTGGFPNIIGLETALLTSGSYAGISQGTYPEWAANVNANGGTPRGLTLDLMDAVDAQMFIASGSSAEAIITTAGVVRKYAGIFNSEARVNLDGRSPVAPVSGSFPAGTMYWHGVPIIRDRDCPTGKMFFINRKNLDARVLPWSPDYDIGLPGVEDKQTISSNGDMAQPTAISCKLTPLAVTGSARRFMIECYLQMRARRPNGLGLLSDISES